MSPIRCTILGQLESSDSKKKILTASMRGTVINRGLTIHHLTSGFPLTGCVTSVEDHGWTPSLHDLTLTHSSSDILSSLVSSV
jgi:hypothetical protein